MEQRSSPVRLQDGKGKAIARDISDSLGKLPPQAPDLEEAILGAILFIKDAIGKVVKFLHPEHFYSDQHKTIYYAIIELYGLNEPIDMRSVVHRLRKNGKLEIVGGAHYIAELTSKVSSSSNIEYHSRIVIEMAIKRDLIQIASQIHHDAYEDTIDVFELLDKSESAIKNISDRNLDQPYVKLDLARAGAEHAEPVQGGETARVDGLKDVFAWMRGFVSGWYGWANDGKGTMNDYLKVVKAKYDGWKFCCYKPEDMDMEVDPNSKNKKIKATRIYKNLAWTLTGKTWNKTFSERWKCPAMTMEEEMEALEFITKHFFIVYYRDRRYKNIIDNFRFMYEKHGIDNFLIDPWNTIILPDNARGDQQLVNAFIDIKEFALETNTSFDIVNHPKSMTDVRTGKGKDDPYKVVNQFMVLGGAAWDMKMDSQYSIYRPERHLNPADPKVHFINLKQKQAEVVGVERGEYTDIIFDKLKKQYYFAGVNPIDGSKRFKKDEFQPNMFTESNAKKGDDDDMPF